MTYLPDLTPITSCLPLVNESLVGVGWLGAGQHYPTGSVSNEFFNKLRELAENPWQPVVSSGFHDCELCQFQPARSSSNLFIPHAGRIYVAPSGILHTIAQHWYLPPNQFIEAVLACPPMQSLAYKRALLANGGRGLVSRQ